MKYLLSFSVALLLLLGSIFPAESYKGLSKEYLLRKCTSEDSCGYTDIDGNYVIPLGKYQCFTDTFRHMAIVYNINRGLIGINRQEQMLFHVFVFDNGPDYPSEGLFRIREKDKIGFANMEGKIVVPARFDFACPFSEGLAAVGFNCTLKPDKYGEHTIVNCRKWGYINKEGKVVIKPEFDKAEDFANGRAQVELNGKSILINQNGQEVKE